jgi:hypothetical protein
LGPEISTATARERCGRRRLAKYERRKGTRRGL